VALRAAAISMSAAAAGGQQARPEPLSSKAGAAPATGAAAPSTHPGAAAVTANGRTAAAPAPAPRSGAAAAAELGVTWCRRAARAVRQRLQDSQQMFREYQYVVALDDTIRHAQNDAMRADCAGRNRYANVLPYDYNRWGCGSTRAWGAGGGASEA
jgi:hypothetical protein